MNREKMIAELSHEYVKNAGGAQIDYIMYKSFRKRATIAVDYMLEKFGPLLEARNTLRTTHEAWQCRCAVCEALKQLEE